jgi:hypothetical protein
MLIITIFKSLKVDFLDLLQPAVVWLRLSIVLGEFVKHRSLLAIFPGRWWSVILK